MNFVFVSVMVALTGLFGLAFAIYGVLTINKGGRKGKQPSNQPSKDSSSNKKTFHRCSTPGCKISIPGQDPHGQCFACCSLDHDMNTCGPCLTSVLVFVFWLLVGNTYDLEVPYKHLYFRTEIQERERV